MSVGVIFDLDNTLYRLKSPDGTFTNSSLNAALDSNACQFICLKLGVTLSVAVSLLNAAKSRGNISLVFERDYGINRYEWFANVWNLEPEQFVTPASPPLHHALIPLSGRALVLTAAPKVWATSVLDYLRISEIFGDLVITGEADFRKPDPEVFLQAADMLQREPCAIVSIGDQNSSDIVPAKRLGMRTIIVGSCIGDADQRANNVLEAVALV